MFSSKNSVAIVPTSDLSRARRFYSETLALPIVADMKGVITFQTGETFLNVYETDKAGTNQANAVCWDCGDDIERIVDELKSRGVAFEHYPEMGMRIEGDLHVDGDFRGAWFKDPDGNILHINSM